MPVFSFVPQEYITQIGQYLMTLPQHLEPYMSHDNPALNRAFRERVFPYCGSGGAGAAKDVLEGETPADFLLNCIATATCQVYQDNILKIPQVSTNSAKQLHVDIGNLSILALIPCTRIKLALFKQVILVTYLTISGTPSQKV